MDLVDGCSGSSYMLVNVGSGLNLGVAGSTAQGAAVDQEGTGAGREQPRLEHVLTR
ncbi:hypothetical protein [Streptomyces sp. NPDC096132]|uniref:hypothetical protein n=1 Tax=Streptomyces sp. NPDC096132 TaxID=3366075 RepID=UPI0038153CB3